MWRMLRAAAEDETPRHGQRLDTHVRRELRLSEAPLDEDDRHFADAIAELLRFVEHLDEKGITVGDHRRNRQAGERLAAPAAVAAGAVAGGEAGDQPDVSVAEGAQQDPVDRPV